MGFLFFVIMWGKGKKRILFFLRRQILWDDTFFVKTKDLSNYPVMRREYRLYVSVFFPSCVINDQSLPLGHVILVCCISSTGSGVPRSLFSFPGLPLPSCLFRILRGGEIFEKEGRKKSRITRFGQCQKTHLVQIMRVVGVRV